MGDNWSYRAPIHELPYMGLHGPLWWLPPPPLPHHHLVGWLHQKCPQGLPIPLESTSHALHHVPLCPVVMWWCYQSASLCPGNLLGSTPHAPFLSPLWLVAMRWCHNNTPPTIPCPLASTSHRSIPCHVVTCGYGWR